MEDVQVRISSFIVRNAMESTASMRQRIVAKTVAELKSQVISLAGNFLGSLTFLGKPAGLYKNIGSGVQDFFYEPYLGSMESPSAFVLGLGKGTGSLISGVASGVLTSAATIVGTATGTVASVASGVAGLGGGDRYMRRREETQRAAKVAQGGVLGGLQAGGESMFSGVYSGVSGLVTKPYKEGKKAGALGFVKGIGLGLVGVATRPVLGITDGISNVAAGFTQQLQQSSGAPAVASHARPARALERADPQDGSNASLLLVPLNLWACEGQKYVLRKALERSYKDAFLASASLGFQAAPGRPPEAPCGVVLSERYLFLLNRQQHKVWEIPCPELSHILLGGDGRTVEFVEYSKDRLASPKRVLCASPEHSLRLYACLARFSHVMGNPGEVQAVAEVAKRLNLPAPGVGGGGMGSRSQSVDGVGGKMSSMGGGGSIGGDASPGSPGAGAGATYRFGSINSVEFPHISQSEEEVLAAAQARFKRISLEEGGGAGGRSAGTGGHSPTSASTDTYYRQLDEALWRLVSDWRNNHNALLNPSRCCACLVINNSPYFVQVREIELKSGLNYLVMGAGDGYDADSRSLSGGGGAAVFFAYGGAPSLTNLAHVKLSLFTSAFNAEQSTRKDRSSVTNHSGFHAGYLEKNQTDYWSKSVIVIKS
ncbi:hypothetical protein B484DRAFT_290199 [Ochromonadaceae sp. CCMP2298]|nr:hypothetical protein B484DRAFT_290199 [Ochromonadaceae sp. CCMP2298]